MLTLTRVDTRIEVKILSALIWIACLLSSVELCGQDLNSPVLLSPADGDTVSSDQVLNFTWVSLAATNGSQKKTFKLYRTKESSPQGVIQLESRAPDFIESQISGDFFQLNPVQFNLMQGWYTWLIELERSILIDETRGQVPVRSEARRFYVKTSSALRCIVEPMPIAGKKLYEVQIGRYIELQLAELFQTHSTKRLLLKVVAPDKSILAQKFLYNYEPTTWSIDLAQNVDPKFLKPGQRLDLELSELSYNKSYYVSVYVR